MFEDWPPVPNWVLWLSIVFVFAYPILKLIWNRWLGDKFAQLNRNWAERRARKLIKHAIRIRDHRDNVPWLITQALRVSFMTTISIGLLVISQLTLVMFEVRTAVTDEFPTPVLKWFVLGAGIVVAYYGLFIAISIRKSFLQPCIQYDEWAVKTGDKVLAMLRRAGLSEDELVPYLEEHWTPNDDGAPPVYENTDKRPTDNGNAK